MLELRPDMPLDPVSIAIIGAVRAAAESAGTSMVIVGAAARDIVLSHIHGIPLRRATADLDFAVAIPGWDAFGQVMGNLQEDRCFRPTGGMAHRLYFRHPKVSYDVPVDIVPFGSGVGKVTFRWPGDPDVEMNVAGYSEAGRNALDVDIDGSSVKVLSAAGLALLKVFAWADRHSSTKKDASDLLALIRHYPELGNHDRMYDDHRLLDDVEHDYLRGGARLLGRDVRLLCEEPTLAAVRAVLTPHAIEKMAAHALGENNGDGLTIDQVVDSFADFAREIQVSR